MQFIDPCRFCVLWSNRKNLGCRVASHSMDQAFAGGETLAASRGRSYGAHRKAPGERLSSNVYDVFTA